LFLLVPAVLCSGSILDHLAHHVLDHRSTKHDTATVAHLISVKENTGGANKVVQDGNKKKLITPTLTGHWAGHITTE